MKTTRNIAGYRVSLDYYNPNINIETIDNILNNVNIYIEKTKVEFKEPLKTWLENILRPFKDDVEYIQLDKYIYIKFTKDDITLPYCNNIPFEVPYINDKIELSNTNLFE